MGPPTSSEVVCLMTVYPICILLHTMNGNMVGMNWMILVHPLLPLMGPQRACARPTPRTQISQPQQWPRPPPGVSLLCCYRVVTVGGSAGVDFVYLPDSGAFRRASPNGHPDSRDPHAHAEDSPRLQAHTDASHDALLEAQTRGRRGIGRGRGGRGHGRQTPTAPPAHTRNPALITRQPTPMPPPWSCQSHRGCRSWSGARPRSTLDAVDLPPAVSAISRCKLLPHASAAAYALPREPVELPPAAKLGEGPEPDLHELLADAGWDSA